MTRAAKSIRGFGVYMAVLGAVLVLTPNSLLGPFGFPETREVR